MRHIHADHIIAAANDTSIEWQRMSDINKDWANVGKSGSFTFYPESQYRQKPAAHPHQAMIDQAWADPSIEWQFKNSIGLGLWLDCKPRHEWFSTCEYRQKPAPHPHQAMIDQAWADPSIEWQHSSQGSDWSDCLHLSGPQWHIGFNYRQKPAEPKMVDMWLWAMTSDCGDIYTSDLFHSTKEDAQNYNTKNIICRIEGSKITVEVSQ